MTIESNNNNKPNKVYYTIKPKDTVKTSFGTEENSCIIDYHYYFLTNDEIPEDKLKEIELFVAKIMNPELNISEWNK